MNAERRARLGELRDKLEEIEQEERAGFENLPESLQGAEQGQAMEAAADNLSEAIESVRVAIEGA